MYLVRYEDNEGNDGVDEFQTAAEAEAAIEQDLNCVKEEYRKECGNYDYGEFFCENGLTTEIWVPGECHYVRWTRLWTKQTSV